MHTSLFNDFDRSAILLRDSDNRRNYHRQPNLKKNFLNPSFQLFLKIGFYSATRRIELQIESWVQPVMAILFPIPFYVRKIQKYNRARTNPAITRLPAAISQPVSLGRWAFHPADCVCLVWTVAKLTST